MLWPVLVQQCHFLLHNVGVYVNADSFILQPHYSYSICTVMCGICNLPTPSVWGWYSRYCSQLSKTSPSLSDHHMCEASSTCHVLNPMLSHLPISWRHHSQQSTNKPDSYTLFFLWHYYPSSLPLLFSLSYPCFLSLPLGFISTPLCLIPLTLLFSLPFSCPDLSKFPSMPACCHCARGIWRDDQLKMMCFAAFFSPLLTHCSCIILYPQQFRRRAGAHWRQFLTIRGLLRCRLSIKKTHFACALERERKKACVAIERDVRGGNRGEGRRGRGEEASEVKTSDWRWVWNAQFRTEKTKQSRNK